MKRSIVSFIQDEHHDWVANLECGHSQHVRHRPPFTVREWVTTEQGRSSKLGSGLNCVRCDRLELPTKVEHYRSTPTFNETSVPKALLKRHATASGVWGRIVVAHGELDYVVEGAQPCYQVLSPSRSGIIVPGLIHRVALRGSVCFRIEFLRLLNVRD